MGFRAVGDNVYGVRQIRLETPKTAREQRGGGPVIAMKHRRHMEIGPKGVTVINCNIRTVWMLGLDEHARQSGDRRHGQKSAHHAE